MVKKVLSIMSSFHPDSLVILGWIAFVPGVLVGQTWLKLILLSAARVLPRALHIAPRLMPNGLWIFLFSHRNKAIAYC